MGNTVWRYKQLRQRSECFFGCHLLGRSCLPRRASAWIFFYSQTAVLSIAEKILQNTKQFSKGSVPSEFVEHIREDHIYTTPGKIQRRNFGFKLNKDKHTLAWPAHLRHSFAARVDQKATVVSVQRMMISAKQTKSKEVSGGQLQLRNLSGT